MRYLLFVLLGASSYGVLSTIVVIAYGKGYQLGEVMGSQMLIGCLLTWGLALLVQRNKARVERHSTSIEKATQLTWKQKLLLMAAGLPTVITGILYYQSLRYIPASLAIILLFQFTWIGVLIQAVSQRKRPNAIMYFTLAVLLGGTLLAAGIAEQESARFHLLGVMLGLLSAVSYSLFILFSGKVLPNAHPAYRSAWMLTGGTLFIFILFPPAFLFNGLIGGPLLLFGLLLGLFGAFIPPVLFAIGVPRIGEGMASILGAAELPVAVLLSSLVLHEYVSLLQWFGVVLVLLGVALPELFNWGRRSVQNGM